MSNIGFKIVTNFERPDRKLVEKFRGIPVANIDDNMNRIFAMDGNIKPYGRPSLCGTAFTVVAPSGDNLMMHKAIDMAQPGDVLVVVGIGKADRSFCGEIMMQMSKSKGIEGFVIDGSIRDAEGTKNLDFPVYATGVQPNGPYKNGPGMINVPVACGHQVVRPGDIIVGDADGVICIPVEYAEEALEKGAAQLAAEEKKIANIIENNVWPSREWIDKTLEAKKCDIE